MPHQLSQQWRLIILVAYVLMLPVASRLALGEWYPPSDEEGLWFYAGLASLLLANLIVSPFFTKPTDAIANGAVGLAGLLAVRQAATNVPVVYSETLWWLALGYVCAVLLTAMLAILLRGQHGRLLALTGTSLFRLVDRLGSAQVLFSVIFFYALVTFHQQSTREFVWLLAAGLVVVLVRPLETIAAWLVVAVRTVRGRVSGTQVGELLHRQEPGLMVIRQTCVDTPVRGDLAVISTISDGFHLGVFMDAQRLAEETWLRYACSIQGRLNEEQCAAINGFLGPPGTAVSVTPEQVAEMGANIEDIRAQREGLVGIVAPDTTPALLVFDVIDDDVDLEEGRLVKTRIRGQDVLFQTIGAVSREELLRQQNTYGYARGRARKIGSWNEDEGRFESVKWIPLVNEPVVMVKEEASAVDAVPVGYFPGTNYPVKVNSGLLVTHNTAVLGILGIGKTMLSLELVERMCADNIRVVVLDITGQYADELPLTESERELMGSRLEGARQVGAAGRENYKRNKEEGGSHIEFRSVLREVLATFLNPSATAASSTTSTSPDRFLVIDPNGFEVWRQDSGMFENRAAMAMLTAVEITRIVTELTLEQVQAQGMTRDARVCLVFEEAHSLIPEWNSVASEGDKTAVNGTARAILQGRKYGLGCLLVTQRTANVTKSILNQCNTVFAMRVYDVTGMEFLRNYIGDDYASILSTMEDRHAVVYGRGSSCTDPVLVRLNDRDTFKNGFRAAYAPGAATSDPVRS